MPTIVVFDNSLSVWRLATRKRKRRWVNPNSNEFKNCPSVRSLIFEVLNFLVDHIALHCKLEFVSLAAFSSSYHVLLPFGRDISSIKKLLENPENDFGIESDKSNFDVLLQSITADVLASWGTAIPVKVVIITDGAPRIGSGSLKEIAKKASKFPFPTKLNIILLCNSKEKSYPENCQLFQSLIDSVSGDGLVYLPENYMTTKGCRSAVAKLCAKEFTPFKGYIRCGELKSLITLCPPPQPLISKYGFRRQEITQFIDIVGFLNISDVGNPPAFSRHLILPLKSTDIISALNFETYSPKSKLNGSPPYVHPDEEGLIPNFCVLLHGALKVESLCAFCHFGKKWYGIIFPWTDNKKKWNLMMTVLKPGLGTLPWLGPLNRIGSRDLYKKFFKRANTIPTFPIKKDKKSYGGTSTSWITANGINSDIQKLLRHARKLPEKIPQFYKELNRMKKWAFVTGFTQILDTTAQVLERECMTLSPAPEVTIQLTHACVQLRSPLLTYNMVIQPCKSN